ncbi:unnamed protein product [Cylicocyclus nassatus]|uniref:Uncharacterized protein n=1 Tax=Cylicocyclus nassatus TaxID=53992 RepID=A0AA36H1U0_CYLNA|nr:unnamed protein product [Cylicocyclus nassatus]
MLAKYICFVSIVATGTALMCKMCDNHITCAHELTELCPPHTQCYTIKRQGRATHKGCASSCAALPFAAGAECATCNHRDHCNDNTFTMGSYGSLGEGVRPSHHNNGEHRGHIGGGVYPNSSPISTISSFAFVMAFISFL